MNKILVFLIGLISLVILSSSVYASTALVGKTAPDFTLRSNQGDNKKLSELRGQVVLINFWASWCGPCAQELPKLSGLEELHGNDGFKLLAINIDEEPEKAINMMKKLGIDFTVLFDETKNVSKQYEIDAMPMTIILDRNGDVRYIHRGYKESYLGLYEQQIKQLKYE
ncbi:MAG: TlpA disulfide reductase family protein [Pseudomonadota bacterium]